MNPENKLSPGTIRLKLVIAYDGCAYAGWQTQKSGLAVQQVMEESLAKLFPGKPHIQGSSRTDTGVHALGLAAHVDVPRAEFKMTPGKFRLAFNAHLPPDIRVMAVSRVRRQFHAQYSATGKQYRYFVWNHPTENPLLRNMAWHVPVALDLKAMRDGARILVGKHDFESFAASRGYRMESYVRTLTKLDIKRQGALLTFIIQGDGFLYKMCRGLAGTLVQMGQGKYQVTDVARMLKDKDRRAGGMTAPAHGLVLWKVKY